jgi:hypothetical protein
MRDKQTPRLATTIFSAVTIFFLFLGFPQGAAAETTSGCHCFKDRTFDPAKKFAADGYILATSFNSLLAKAYDIPKKQIILLKMQGGVDQNDLLIALRIAKLSGTDLQQILLLKDGKHSWQGILAAPDLANRTLSDPLLKKIKTGLTDAEAGKQAADLLLADFFKVSPATVDKLRATGLNEKELALIFILAQAKGSPPSTFATQYQKEGKSWSEIADSLGIEPAAAGKLILNSPSKP